MGGGYRFVMPWNIFNRTDRDKQYGLCTRTAPWSPTVRGMVLRRLCGLTQGMGIIRTDPKGTGVTVLAGRGRKLWVWQNRRHWSTLYGTTFVVEDIPPAATRLEVHGWTGLSRTINLHDEAILTIFHLPVGETVMLLAA